MNRVNPLHIIALLLVVLIFVVFKLSGAKDKLVDVKESFNKTQIIATELNGLKKVYDNKTKTKKELLKILNLSSLRNSSIQKDMKKTGIKISSQSVDKRVLNTLMGKVLNGSFNVKSFKVKKLDEHKASFDMEIKW
jgi:hypothetical protein